MSIQPVLSCNHVAKFIAGKRVLNDVSFSAYEGEIVAMIGPNGAGKTTLLKIMGSLVAQDFGEINIFGTLMNPSNRDLLLPDVGMVIDVPVFETGTTVESAIVKHLSFMGSDRSADEAIRRVGLEELKDAPTQALSMGNRARLSLAIALSHGPKLLLLDEPLNGLDPTGMALFCDLAREEAKRGSTLIVSAHMLAELETFCDRVIVINHGWLSAQADMNSITSLEDFYFRNTKD